MEGGGEVVTSDAFAAYSPVKTKALLEELDEQIAALRGLKEQVVEAMGEWERSAR